MAKRTEIVVQNPHEFNPDALTAAVQRAQRLVLGDLPEHWESTRVTIHSNGRDRDGMLECMIVHTAEVPDVTATFSSLQTKVVIAIGMIQRPGSTEFEFHS